MTELQNFGKLKLRKTLDAFLVMSSIGGSIAAVVSQQVAIAVITSVPLSLAMGLNLTERRRLEDLYRQHTVQMVTLEETLQQNLAKVDQTVGLIESKTENFLKDIQNLRDHLENTETLQQNLIEIWQDIRSTDKNTDDLFQEIQLIHSCVNNLEALQQRLMKDHQNLSKQVTAHISRLNKMENFQCAQCKQRFFKQPLSTFPDDFKVCSPECRQIYQKKQPHA